MIHVKTLVSVALLLACAGPASGAEPSPPAHTHHAPITGASAARAPDAPPPAGYRKVDPEFVSCTVRGRMKYDPDSLKVMPGAKVKLVLKNADEMQHNLVLCK